MDEFAAIDRIRTICQPVAQHQFANLIMNDDCVSLSADSNLQIFSSIDTVVMGVHLPDNLPPNAIASRALLAAFSDISAMGAIPLGCLVALNVNKTTAEWIDSFAQGMLSVLLNCKASLLGGNLTNSKLLSVTTTVFGYLPKNSKPLLRSGAKQGDDIYITGEIGMATLGLSAWQGKAIVSADENQQMKNNFSCPKVPFNLSQKIAPFANSAIDISDGLFADLSHILQASKFDATIDINALPLQPTIAKNIKNLPDSFWKNSDDYQLCFTACKSNRKQISDIIKQNNTACKIIGSIEQASTKPIIKDINGKQITTAGYQHF